jgi:type VI secretion system protein ImpA
VKSEPAINDAPFDPAAPPQDATAPAQPSLDSPPNPSALLPISPDDPCGPDLDLEGDAEFLNFVAGAEGMLPGGPAEQYYKFSRADADIPARLQAAEKLLGRTLDIRLLTILARLSILNRDVAGFARWVCSIDWLLRTYWDAAHPRAGGRLCASARAVD